MSDSSEVIFVLSMIVMAVSSVVMAMCLFVLTFMT